MTLHAVHVPAEDGHVHLERTRWADGQISWRWHVDDRAGRARLSFVDSVDAWETIQLALELRETSLAIFATCGGELTVRASGADPALPDRLHLTVGDVNGAQATVALGPDALCLLIDAGLADHRGLSV